MRISMIEIWRNLDGPPKNKELWSYVVSLNLVGRKVAHGLTRHQLGICTTGPHC